MIFSTLRACFFAAYLIFSTLNHICQASSPISGENNQTMAILGDSYSTGAGLVDGFEYDPDVFWDLLKDKNRLTKSFTPSQQLVSFANTDHHWLTPNWLPSSPREWSFGVSSLTWQFMRKISSDFLDEPRRSWGYLLAAKHQIKPENLWYAAQDGSSIDQLIFQFDRLLYQFDRSLPDYTFAHFSLQDLCGPTISDIRDAASYKQAVTQALKFLYIQMKNTSARVPKVFLMSPLSLPSILADTAVLDKKVKAKGKEVSCKYLRQHSYLVASSDKNHRYIESDIFGHILPPNGAHYCPSMVVLTLPRRFPLAKTSTAPIGEKLVANNQRNIEFEKKQVEENLSTLASRVRQFRRATRDAIAEVKSWARVQQPNKSLDLIYLDVSRGTHYLAEDLGADCIHFSDQGQLKFAQNIEAALVKSSQKPSTLTNPQPIK